MNDHETPETAHFRQEPDPSYNRSALGVGLVAAIIFCGGILWAWLTLASREKLLLPDGPLANPPEATLHKEEVGIVFQTQFNDTAWPAENRRREAILEQYGWTDRKNNRIHIPIEKAMEMVAAGQGK